MARVSPSSTVTGTKQGGAVRFLSFGATSASWLRIQTFLTIYAEISKASLYTTTRRDGSDLSFSTCKEQLFKLIDFYPKTTLILDALDECEPTTRGLLFELIESLQSKAKKPLKIFVSSRPVGILESFQQA